MKFNFSKSHGSYRIRFTHEGKRRDFRPGTKDEAVATAIVKQMTYEWETGQFDLTLERYKVKNRDAQIKLQERAIVPPKLIDIWEAWVKWTEVPPETYNNTHVWLEKEIRKADPVWDNPQWFLDRYGNTSPSTFNRYKGKLKSCIAYGIDSGLIVGRNPYALIKSKKSKGKGNHVKPFSRDEIKRIIEALESDRFVHPMSRFTHSHYVPFVQMMFATGLRLGEIAGLTWDCIDWENKKIIIRQALGKDFATSHTKSYKKIKATKTNTEYSLPINKTIAGILEGIQFNKNIAQCNRKINYVFIGQNNSYLDLCSFRRYVWKPVLEKLGIPYRYPYQSRHTVLSEVASTQGLMAAAAVAGHKSVDMVSRHYARFTGEIVLPKLIDT